MPTLTVHNAEICTASVEVKTLTIAGKQVTQSVFKQLKDRELITDDGRLNGTPWGIVNYHPGKCADDAPHLHVVWQIGSELYRAKVDLEVVWPKTITTRHGVAYLKALTREACLRGTELPVASDAVHVREFLGVWVQIDPDRELLPAVYAREQLDDFQKAMDAQGPDARVTYCAFRVGRPRPVMLDVSLSAAYRAAWHELDQAVTDLGAESLELAESCLLEEVRPVAEFRSRHRDVRKALTELPQLFIAV